MKSFVVMELVRTSKDNRREIAFQCGGDYERVARARFAELSAQFPNTYFELLAIEHKEECLEFTKDRV